MISNKKTQVGQLWIKENEHFPVPAISGLAHILEKYKSSNFYNQITANNIIQTFTVEDVLGIQTPRGLAIEKLKDLSGVICAHNTENNLCATDTYTLTQWWIDTESRQIFYVSLDPQWSMQWRSFDIESGTTQTLFTSSISSYFNGVPEALSVCFNPATQKFNLSFSYTTTAIFGLGSVRFYNHQPWGLDPSLIQTFEIPL